VEPGRDGDVDEHPVNLRLPLRRIATHVRRRAVPALTRRDHRTVLYESFDGRYSDSPRAICEALRGRGGAWRHVWASKGDSSSFPDWVEVVEKDSVSYLRALGRASHVFVNSGLPGYYRKKRGVCYVQTWHGTPLKRIGFDVPGPQFADGDRYFRRLRREAARWDHLVSPNPFSTPLFRGAFRYEGSVLEVGYPRNDSLCSDQAQSVRQRVRAQLNIPEGNRVLLYAPTWRDDEVDTHGRQHFRLQLDLATLESALGGGWTVLLRLHPLVAGALGPVGSPIARDASNHADVGELFLTADVLVTDYSSVMFDFAVTAKPVLLFTYDLARYRDQLRGFYFDIEAAPPGPLVSTTEELAEVLLHLEEVAAHHADDYERFRAEFCPLDDGHASQRVLDAVLGPDRLGPVNSSRRVEPR
jgi:CDP-glycerol glycerophosphotransferase